MPAALATPAAVLREAPPPRRCAFDRLRLVLGLLLLITAVLKMAGGSGEIMRTALPFVSPRLYASGVLVEALLGVWLLSGLATAWSWLTSLFFFGLLAALSSRLGFLGQASCGCAGKIPLSPWWAFGVDVAAIAGLLTWRPDNLRLGLKAGLPSLVGCAVAGLFTTSALSLIYGSPAAAFARLNGETITVTPPVSQLGVGEPNEIRSITITVTNHNDDSIRVVGGTSNCACVATDDLPFELVPGESRTITVRMRFTGSPGEFYGHFRLYTDDDKLRVTPIMVTGRVQGP